jgi:hypothetical protein
MHTVKSALFLRAGHTVLVLYPKQIPTFSYFSIAFQLESALAILSMMMMTVHRVVLEQAQRNLDGRKRTLIGGGKVLSELQKCEFRNFKILSVCVMDFIKMGRRNTTPRGVTSDT